MKGKKLLLSVGWVASCFFVSGVMADDSQNAQGAQAAQTSQNSLPAWTPPNSQGSTGTMVGPQGRKSPLDQWLDQNPDRKAQFDANGDGTLDFNERAQARRQFFQENPPPKPSYGNRPPWLNRPQGPMVQGMNGQPSWPNVEPPQVRAPQDPNAQAAAPTTQGTDTASSGGAQAQ